MQKCKARNYQSRHRRMCYDGCMDGRRQIHCYTSNHKIIAFKSPRSLQPLEESRPKSREELLMCAIITLESSFKMSVVRLSVAASSHRYAFVRSREDSTCIKAPIWPLESQNMTKVFTLMGLLLENKRLFLSSFHEWQQPSRP